MNYEEFRKATYDTQNELKKRAGFLSFFHEVIPDYVVLPSDNPFEGIIGFSIFKEVHGKEIGYNPARSN